MGFRVGIGYDVHKLHKNRELILGGVKIDFLLGLQGHSDADVLTHAVMDSILGAMKKGDIGRHFPDNDDSYKNISSLILLDKVRCIMEKSEYKIVNIDCVIVAQNPKLAPYIPGMERNIADVLKTDISNVNIKATTEEYLGFTGRMEGISAKVICMIESV